MEDERSLARRESQVPARLMQGGLIVGVEERGQGSLMGMTGIALERITRERTEVPPQFKLPERPTYFLDPSTRRMIMISNREPQYREHKTEDKYGLFAEVVEVDEDGKPRFSLSTSQVSLNNETYLPVHVGPNEYNLPPSYLEMEEEKEGQEKKFVPWNVYLGQLQEWMNQASINPNEDLDTFLKKFEDMRAKATGEAGKKIDQSFPRGEQGFGRQTALVNMIISNDGKDGPLARASFAAGLFPVVVSTEDFLKTHSFLDQHLDIDQWKGEIHKVLYEPNTHMRKENYRFTPGVITLDEESVEELFRNRTEIHDNLPAGTTLERVVEQMQKYFPVFAIVRAYPMLEDDPGKLAHGSYASGKKEDLYRGMLNKLKADLIMTMYLRGGAPIIK